jgi:hypothetical protein
LHVALIVWVGVRTIRARVASVLGGETKLKAIALSNAAWPDNVRKLGNNFDNQFDVPMLWYAVCALLLVTGKADWIGVGLSWAFLIARLLHSLVHTGSNNVPLRMRAFLASVATVVAMWVWFGIRLFVIG